MPSRRWLTIFISVLAAFLVLTGTIVGVLDPFFHYHAPLSGFYYELSDQRYQNDGITRHFSYDAVITGTSMVENFRTSELDTLLGTNSVKLPYPGATYKEINDNLEKAFETHPDGGLRYVIRGLDLTHLMEDKDAMRTDMGQFPTYLYDNNPWNDVKYLYNSTVLFQYILPMLGRKITGAPGGVSSFDDYSWSGNDIYSAQNALQGRTSFSIPSAKEITSQPGLTTEERQMLEANIETNVVNIAKNHPETTFILFFPPYSALWYASCLEEGTFQKYLEAEEVAAEKILTCENVHLFLFSSNTAITTDLDNYKDNAHYSPAINSWMLQEMTDVVLQQKPSPYELTKTSSKDLFSLEKEIYENLDYNQLLQQAKE